MRLVRGHPLPRRHPTYTRSSAGVVPFWEACHRSAIHATARSNRSPSAFRREAPARSGAVLFDPGQ